MPSLKQVLTASLVFGILSSVALVTAGQEELPPVVTPGLPGLPDRPGTAPSDAVVLLGPGTGWKAWRRSADPEPSEWSVDADGIGQVNPGKGNIRTRAEFGDCHIHVEWQVPEGRECNGQSGCNSGVYVMGRYEVQILGAFDNDTYPGGTAGAWYNQHVPLANPCRPPGEWNTYDIIFRAPRFDANGKQLEPPMGTVIFNGVVVQNNAIIKGPTGSSMLKGPASKGPLFLQDHSDPIRFANIWVRPL